MPGHIGLEGNERADLLANEGGRKDQVDKPIPYCVAVKTVKRDVRSILANKMLLQLGIMLLSNYLQSR